MYICSGEQNVLFRHNKKVDKKHLIVKINYYRLKTFKIALKISRRELFIGCSGHLNLQ